MLKIADAPNSKLLKAIPEILLSLGMTPITESSLILELKDDRVNSATKYYIVMLDGRILGYVYEPLMITLTNTLRYFKIIGKVIYQILM